MGRWKGDESGFAAVDALVALVILATTITLAIGAVTTGRRASSLAGETRAADGLMTALLNDAVRQPGSYRGQTRRFDWRLRVAVLPAEPPLRLCRSTVEVRGRTTRRRFVLAGDDFCPPPPKVEAPAS